MPWRALAKCVARQLATVAAQFLRPVHKGPVRLISARPTRRVVQRQKRQPGWRHHAHKVGLRRDFAHRSWQLRPTQRDSDLAAGEGGQIRFDDAKLMSDLQRGQADHFPCET